MRKHAEILFFHSVGWVFIVTGVAAGFVPFVPGFVIVIIGIYVISLRSVWLKKRLDFFRKHYPSFDRVILRFEERVVKVWLGFINIIKYPIKFFFKNNK